MRCKLLLEKALSIYTMDQLYEYTVKASNHYSKNRKLQVAAVNYRGVLSTMRHLLGEHDCALVSDQIIKNFAKVDVGNLHLLDRDDFEDFFNLMLKGSKESSVVSVKRELRRMSTCHDMFDSSRGVVKAKTKRSKDEFGIKKHLNGDGKFSAKNWNMLYCGGSQPVLDQLKDFKRKFGIGLSVEKFDW